MRKKHKAFISWAGLFRYNFCRKMSKRLRSLTKKTAKGKKWVLSYADDVNGIRTELN
jgi:hypothetical protein